MKSEAGSNKKIADIELAFDVGHSSIGWAVLDNQKLELLGCGSVIFPADDCLASQRRTFRRQRRHIRATRLRIERMKRLLEHLGMLTRSQLDLPGCAWPWLLAARVLRGGSLLTWPQLWDVLRWYAHNRGYDGNRAWSAADVEAEEEDTEKVNNARALYAKCGTHTMAETFCAVCGLDPLGGKKSCNLPGDKRPKALNAAFPREDVEREVYAILQKHVGLLPEVNAALLEALLNDAAAIPAVNLRLPMRYRGGLLFGQLVPRFENRIIATCPIMFERVYQRLLKENNDAERASAVAEKVSKVPSKECVEFYAFRWSMLLANIQVKGTDGLQPLISNKGWREALDRQMRAAGFLTPGELKKSVRKLTDNAPDNLDQLLLHPDAGEALIFDPARKLVATNAALDAVWPKLPEQTRKYTLNKWRQGRQLSPSGIISDLDEADRARAKAAFADFITTENSSKKKRKAPLTLEGLLATKLSAKLLSGRAPYHREIMREAVADVMERGIHPTEERGCLYRSEAIRNAQLHRAIDDQTNNHLVRHRLLILERLHRDILKEYAGGVASSVARVTIEVNRDLQKLSGKTAKQVAQDLGQRLANFKSVTKRLEAAFEGQGIKITPGLIRKARIADDLGWTCPYTGQKYDEFDLLNRKVDKDHIIPRSERPSDSLDSLVITFSEINKWKGSRTALCFVEDEQSKPVPGLPNLTIKTLKRFKEDGEALETFKGHDDDQRRKKNRKRLLQLRTYVDKEFTPRDLTQTSQLVRLGAQILQKAYAGSQKSPVITSIPGGVTGAVRRSWNLLGCLAAANPLVLDENNEVKTKTEIRDITHLHHALDACVLAFTSQFLPRDGGIWELLVKRRLNEAEQRLMRQRLHSMVQINGTGEFRLADLPEGFKKQIRERLAERRVMQHIPKEMAGLRAEQNAWRVVKVENGEVHLRQRIRKPDGSRPLKEKTEKIGKVIGLQPGELQRRKAVLVIPDNYGLALDPEPTIIPFHKVWPRIQELRQKNGGKLPRVLRNGGLIAVPKGLFAGLWKIFSVKNNASGIAVDIGSPDATRLQNKTMGHKINVRLTTLLKDGMEILATPYTGVAACPTTSST